MSAIIKKDYIRKIYVPPIADFVILNDMDALLRRSIKIVDDDEDEFEAEIEGSTEPARSKGSYNWIDNWDK